MVKPSDILMNASCIFKHNPDMWTQRAFGRNKKERPCSIFSNRAIKFCSTGILWKYGDTIFEEAAEYLEKVINADIITWNDDPARTIEQVSEAFEKAAKLAEANGD